MQVPSGLTPGPLILHVTSNSVTSQDVTMPASKTGITAAGAIQTYNPQDIGVITGKIIETGAAVTTDENGNYSLDTPAGNTTVRLQGHGQYYSWTSNTTNVKGATNVGTTQLFPIFNDPNALYDFNRTILVDPDVFRPETLTWTAGTNPMDGLDFMYWMNVYFLADGPCQSTKSGRIRDSDLPFTIYGQESQAPPDGARAVQAAINDINTKTGTQIYQYNAGTLPAGANGYNIQWQTPPYLSANENVIGEFVDTNAISCVAPTAGEIYISPQIYSSPEEIQLLATHEMGHGMNLGVDAHSIYNKHIMYYIVPGDPSVTGMSVFEGTTAKYLYWLTLGTDLSRYDKLPE
jgi:hypothetical protein